MCVLECSMIGHIQHETAAGVGFACLRQKLAHQVSAVQRDGGRRCGAEAVLLAQQLRVGAGCRHHALHTAVRIASHHCSAQQGIAEHTHPCTHSTLIYILVVGQLGHRLWRINPQQCAQRVVSCAATGKDVICTTIRQLVTKPARVSICTLVALALGAIKPHL